MFCASTAGEPPGFARLEHARPAQSGQCADEPRAADFFMSLSITDGIVVLSMWPYSVAMHSAERFIY